QNPGPDEYPAQAAAEWVPQADVLAVTSMTLLNGTLDGLLALRRPDAMVLLLGPSTPLHPLLFDYGITFLSGASVVNIDAVLRVVREGAVFRQVRKAGVRLVTIACPLGKQKRVQALPRLAPWTGATGFEPAISGLTGRRVNHYTTPPANNQLILSESRGIVK